MGIAAFVCTQAYAEGWRLGVGVSYRDFQDLEFESFSLRNYNQTDPTTGNLGLQGYENNVTLVPYTGGFAVDHAAFKGTGEDFSTGSRTAPVITLEKSWRQDDALHLSWVFNLQYYDLDNSFGTDVTGAAASRYFNTFNRNHWSVGGNLAPAFPGATPGLQAGTKVFVRHEFDLDLYVLDFGLKADYATKFANFSLAGGPTLNLSLADSRRTEGATWNPVGGTADPGSYTRSESASRDQLVLGGYLAAGVNFSLTERWTLAAEYRYDVASEKVGTHHAELDLDGQSLLLRLSYAF